MIYLPDIQVDSWENALVTSLFSITIEYKLFDFNSVVAFLILTGLYRLDFDLELFIALGGLVVAFFFTTNFSHWPTPYVNKHIDF